MSVPTPNYTAISGSKTIGGTAGRIIASSTPLQYGVQVTLAKASSANQVYVGFSSGVTAGGTPATDGYELSSQNPGTFIPAGTIQGDLSNLYVIGSTTGCIVYFWAV